MYIAKKRCKFAGHGFRIGEPIPEGYVHDTAAPRLISIGVIAEVPEGSLLPSEPSIEEKQEEGQEKVDTNSAQDQEPGDANGGPGEDQEPDDADGDSGEDQEPDDADGDSGEDQDLDFEALLKRKRSELVELARQHGIEAEESDTKKGLAEAILEAQRSDA